MPIFELKINLNSFAIPSDSYIRMLLKEAGNTEFETFSGDYGKSTLVKCKYKPRDSAIFGVQWLEHAGQKHNAEAR